MQIKIENIQDNGKFTVVQPTINGFAWTVIRKGIGVYYSHAGKYDQSDDVDGVLEEFCENDDSKNLFNEASNEQIAEWIYGEVMDNL